MSNLRRIIWLASYPKSGNTWLRTLLAHYLSPEGKAPDINNLRDFTTGDSRQDAFNEAVGREFVAKNFEDWVRTREKALHVIAGLRPSTHFVKTHCPPIRLFDVELIPSKYTVAAIYIMRNPFDLAPSYARHQSCDIDLAIKVMLDPEGRTSTKTGIYDFLGRWDAHVDTWTTAPGLPRHVIRYEDMLEDTQKAMSGLLGNFLKVPVLEAKLAKTIEANSFEALKKQEAQFGFKERPKGMKSFFAKGQSGVWREDLEPRQIEQLRDAFLPILKKWYPDVLSDVDEFLKSA